MNKKMWPLPSFAIDLVQVKIDFLFWIFKSFSIKSISIWDVMVCGIVNNRIYCNLLGVIKRIQIFILKRRQPLHFCHIWPNQMISQSITKSWLCDMYHIRQKMPKAVEILLKNPYLGVFLYYFCSYGGGNKSTIQ